MEVLTLLIAIVALVIGSIAFQRTGGIKELKRLLKSQTAPTETAAIVIEQELGEARRQRFDYSNSEYEGY